MMKQVQYSEYGTSEVMSLKSVERPVPGTGEVLVRVHAAGINELDWKIRNGNLKIQDGRDFPKLMGCELSGEVVAVGKAVDAEIDSFLVGDAVFGWLPFDQLGAFAEYAVISADKLHHKPASLSHVQAAAFPMVGATALQALTKEVALSLGQTVLINGATGGVGHLAVQIAHGQGAKVIAVASGEHLEFARSLGADSVVDYHKTDVRERDEKFDVILDTSKTLPWSEAKGLLREKGAYLDLQPGLKAFVGSFIQNVFSDRTHDVLGVTVDRSDLAQLAELSESDRLKVTVDHVVEFGEYKSALSALESGEKKIVGKAVLRMVD